MPNFNIDIRAITPEITKVAIICIAYIVSLKIFKKFWKKLLKAHDELHWRFIGNLIRVMLTILFVSFLGSLFTDTKEISVAIFSSTGVAVALLLYTAQELLKDLIAGLAISFSKPYKIGSVINVTSLDISGIVEDITLRHTIVKCYDNTRLIVPNSVMNGAILSNRDFDKNLIGNYLEIKISYDSNIKKAKEIIYNTVVNHPLVVDSTKDSSIEKHCSVLLKDFGDDGLVLKTTVWTRNINDNFAACDEIRMTIKEQFDANNIEIPFATRTVHIVSDTNTNNTK